MNRDFTGLIVFVFVVIGIISILHSCALVICTPSFPNKIDGKELQQIVYDKYGITHGAWYVDVENNTTIFYNSLDFCN